MKHSSTWFALILIASALLPSGASSANAQSPNPRIVQNQVGQAQPSETKTQEPEGEPAGTAAAGIPTASRQEVSSQQDQHPADGYLQKARQWIASIWTVEYTIATATIVYSFFAILQWFALKKTVGETKSLVVTADRQAKAAEAQVTNLEKTLLATEKAAGAAVKNADAALAASAAYLDITSFWLETEKKGSDVMDSGVGVVDPLLHWTLTNHGKSPAIVTELCWQKFFGLRLPDIPIYNNFSRLPRELVIGAEKGDEQAHQWSFLFGNYLTEQDMEPVRKMESRLQIYGYVRYRDIFDRRIIIGYAFRLNAKGEPGLVTEEEAARYIYRRFE